MHSTPGALQVIIGYNGEGSLHEAICVELASGHKSNQPKAFTFTEQKADGMGSMK
jgi:hypothetical protein